MVALWQRFGSAGEFWRVVREVSMGTVRDEACRHFHVVILGRRGTGKSTLIQILAGDNAGGVVAGFLVEVDVDSEGIPAQVPADLYIYVASAASAFDSIDLQHVAGLCRHGRPVLLFITHCDEADAQALEPRLRTALSDLPAAQIVLGNATNAVDVARVFGGAILRALPQRHLALARRLPLLRAKVGDDLIDEVARVNAEFALASSLPAVVPFIGNIVGDVGDLLVLTKNQAMLIFKLAAIHERDMDTKLRLIAEIAPIVGGAFFWRTIARELVGLLPGAVAVVPKTTIAYAGTYVVGKIAQYYYTTNLRPSPATITAFAAEARLRYGRIKEWLLSRWSRNSGDTAPSSGC